MDDEKIRLHATRFEALTSLTVEEFDNLLNHFSVKWDKYYRYNTLEGNLVRMEQISVNWGAA